MNYAKIELSEQEALMFTQFRKRQAFMELMEKEGIFDIRNGSVTLHFNSFGGIDSIEKRIVKQLR